LLDERNKFVANRLGNYFREASIVSDAPAAQTKRPAVIPRP